MAEQPIINDLWAGKEILVVFERISETGAAFERRVGDRSLSFELLPGDSFLMRDLDTGSTYFVSGTQGAMKFRISPSNEKAKQADHVFILLVFAGNIQEKQMLPYKHISRTREILVNCPVESLKRGMQGV